MCLQKNGIADSSQKKSFHCVPLPKNRESAVENRKIMKLNIQLITAAVLSAGGIVLLFIGAFIAPEGEIHESLLVGFGEVVTFSGALFGIDYTYKYKDKNKNRS